ncbi:hypothetical protein NDU88_000749 [Pleurodeles waltl]|uniref:Uncharacterized protein n=1 Tax=Pleurodeles waltl TaxID=8319 RepID=A0AAV7R6Z0_PLEWA|nr:hypothetical protein NDU88_000749 [Pleurodeles waltl]
MFHRTGGGRRSLLVLALCMVHKALHCTSLEYLSSWLQPYVHSTMLRFSSHALLVVPMFHRTGGGRRSLLVLALCMVHKALRCTSLEYLSSWLQPYVHSHKLRFSSHALLVVPMFHRTGGGSRSSLVLALCMVHKALHCTSLEYLRSSLQPYVHSTMLRFSSHALLVVPMFHRTGGGRCSFVVLALCMVHKALRCTSLEYLSCWLQPDVHSHKLRFSSYALLVVPMFHRTGGGRRSLLVLALCMVHKALHCTSLEYLSSSLQPYVHSTMLRFSSHALLVVPMFHRTGGGRRSLLVLALCMVHKALHCTSLEYLSSWLQPYVHSHKLRFSSYALLVVPMFHRTGGGRRSLLVLALCMVHKALRCTSLEYLSCWLQPDVHSHKLRFSSQALLVVPMFHRTGGGRRSLLVLALCMVHKALRCTSLEYLSCWLQPDVHSHKLCFSSYALLVVPMFHRTGGGRRSLLVLALCMVHKALRCTSLEYLSSWLQPYVHSHVLRFSSYALLVVPMFHRTGGGRRSLLVLALCMVHKALRCTSLEYLSCWLQPYVHSTMLRFSSHALLVVPMFHRTGGGRRSLLVLALCMVHKALRCTSLEYVSCWLQPYVHSTMLRFSSHALLVVPMFHRTGGGRRSLLVLALCMVHKALHCTSLEYLSSSLQPYVHSHKLRFSSYALLVVPMFHRTGGGRRSSLVLALCMVHKALRCTSLEYLSCWLQPYVHSTMLRFSSHALLVVPMFHRTGGGRRSLLVLALCMVHKALHCTSLEYLSSSLQPYVHSHKLRFSSYALLVVPMFHRTRAGRRSLLVLALCMVHKALHCTSLEYLSSSLQPYVHSHKLRFSSHALLVVPMFHRTGGGRCSFVVLALCMVHKALRCTSLEYLSCWLQPDVHSHKLCFSSHALLVVPMFHRTGGGRCSLLVLALCMVHKALRCTSLEYLSSSLQPYVHSHKLRFSSYALLVVPMFHCTGGGSRSSLVLALCMVHKALRCTSLEYLSSSLQPYVHSHKLRFSSHALLVVPMFHRTGGGRRSLLVLALCMVHKALRCTSLEYLSSSLQPYVHSTMLRFSSYALLVVPMFHRTGGGRRSFVVLALCMVHKALRCTCLEYLSSWLQPDVHSHVLRFSSYALLVVPMFHRTGGGRRSFVVLALCMVHKALRCTCLEYLSSWLQPDVHSHKLRFSSHALLVVPMFHCTGGGRCSSLVLALCMVHKALHCTSLEYLSSWLQPDVHSTMLRFSSHALLVVPMFHRTGGGRRSLLVLALCMVHKALRCTSLEYLSSWLQPDVHSHKLRFSSQALVVVPIFHRTRAFTWWGDGGGHPKLSPCGHIKVSSFQSAWQDIIHQFSVSLIFLQSDLAPKVLQRVTWAPGTWHKDTFTAPGHAQMK